MQEIYDPENAVQTENAASTETDRTTNNSEGGSDAAKKKLRRYERSVKWYQRLVLQIIIILVILWALFYLIVGITHMPNADMYPKVNAGDLILFSRLNRTPMGHEVVIYEKNLPDGNGKHVLVSRVVAREGDTVEVTDDGTLVVNGYTVFERDIHTKTKPVGKHVKYPVTLKEGEYFVLADDRENGTDSRYFGPVTKKEIKGTVITLLRRHDI